MKKIVTIVIVFLCTSIMVFAQDANIDTNVKKQFKNGTILSSPDGILIGHNFDVCKNSYDPYLLGIYFNENPEWDPNNPTRSYKFPIITEGITYVRVNNENGQILAGDLITSSAIPGVGMKATKSGIILGIALEDASVSSNLVKIRVMIQYVR